MTENRHWIEKPVLRGFDELEWLYPALNGKGFIAGSFAAYMCADEVQWQPNDIDIFSTGQSEQVEKYLYENGFFVERCWEFGCEWLPDGAAPISRPIQVLYRNPNWQTFPDDIINSFDFTVCRAVLVSPETVLADVDAGTLRGLVTKVNSPIKSALRMLKYTRRGVEFEESEIVKLFQAWQNMSAEQQAAALNVYTQEDSTPADYDWYDEDDYFFSE